MEYPCGSATNAATSEEDIKLKSGARRQKAWISLLTLALGNFFSASIFSLQGPFFPLEAEKKGATPTEYGLIYGIYQLVFFVMSPVAGKLVSFIGPKILLCFGIFMLGACCVLFGMLSYVPSGTPFLVYAFGIRIVEGFGAAVFTTTSFTIIAAEFPDKVGTTFAVVGSSFGVGLIAGPTIGGALYEVGGFPLPFVAIGGLMVIYSFVTYCLLPRIERGNARDSVGLKDTLIFWGHYSTLVPSFCTFSNFLIVGFNGAILEPHIRQFGLSPFLVGLMFVIAGGIYGATAPLWGWICDKWVSPKLMCFIGTIGTSIFCLFIGPAPFFPFDTKLWLVIISLIFFGFGAGMKYVSAFAALSKDTKKRGYPENLTTNGLISSVFAASQALGNFFGPSVGGFLFDNIGYRNTSMVFLTVELLMVIVTCAYFIHERNTPKTSELVQISSEDETTSLIQIQISSEDETTSLIQIRKPV